ncbi:hypothetical protein ACFL55_03250, partial [Candidatus Latescibacterota bacterium]
SVLRGVTEMISKLFKDVVNTNENLQALFSDKEWWPRRDAHISCLSNISQISAAICPQKYISPSSIIEDGTKLSGNVIVLPGTTIRSGSYILGPTIIGENSTIGPNSFINGCCIIGPRSFVGQSAELKSSILMGQNSLAHFSYIGNSILGREVSISAGVITAVRRFDRKSVALKIGLKVIDTGTNKLGVIIGDGTQVGVGVLIYPGRSIAPSICVLPGTIIMRNINHAADAVTRPIATMGDEDAYR